MIQQTLKRIAPAIATGVLILTSSALDVKAAPITLKCTQTKGGAEGAIVHLELDQQQRKVTSNIGTLDKPTLMGSIHAWWSEDWVLWSNGLSNDVGYLSANVINRKTGLWVQATAASSSGYDSHTSGLVWQCEKKNGVMF